MTTQPEVGATGGGGVEAETRRAPDDDEAQSAEALGAQEEGCLRLRAAVAILETEVETQTLAYAASRATLAALEKQQQEESRRCLELEQQRADLINLYTATHSLHSSVGRDDVLEAIRDVVINLIGSDQVAIFERRRGTDVLLLAPWVGLQPLDYALIRLGGGVIGQAAARGELYVADEAEGGADSRDEPRLTACVPLRIDDEVIGLIAIFRLLPHKTGLEPLDLDLLRLLATHAGTALYRAQLRLGSSAPTEGVLHAAPTPDGERRSPGEGRR
jgi:putative methionine-R-sulfoxide reductase with GAF domain